MQHTTSPTQLNTKKMGMYNIVQYQRILGDSSLGSQNILSLWLVTAYLIKISELASLISSSKLDLQYDKSKVVPVLN
jgi:hypothetical protein